MGRPHDPVPAGADVLDHHDLAAGRRLEVEALNGTVADVAAADWATDGEALVQWSKTSGDVEGAFARADLVVSERFRTPRWSCNPVETCGVVADWNRAAGTLTAWANFQGPFTLHGVADCELHIFVEADANQNKWGGRR